MSKKQQKSFQKLLVMLSLVGGVALMISGGLSGNQSLIKPDFQKNQTRISSSRISPEELKAKSDQVKSAPKLVVFDSYEACGRHMVTSKQMRCFAYDQLDDLKWIRSTFRNVNKPLVVYAVNEDQKIKAASILDYYGYKVQVLDLPEKELTIYQELDRGMLGLIAMVDPKKQSNTNTLLNPNNSEEQSDTVLDIQSNVLQSTPVASSPSQATAEADDSEDEEEEEGC